MKTSYIIPAACGLVLMLAGCNGIRSTKSGLPGPAMMQSTPIVTVVEACFADVPQDGVYSTTVQANAINNIVPQGGSRIRKINVEVGDYVAKNKILAEMDRSNLNASELQLKNTTAEFDRIKVLYQKGGVSQSDYESAELALNVAKNSYENLLENTILRSPIEGVISARGYDEGDMYAMAGPLFVVQQISPVKMIVAVSEKDYSKVSVGDKVEISADAFPGETFDGKVSMIYPVVDAATHTVSVEVKVPNKDRRLRPGMYASAKVTFAVNKSVVVPEEAVVKQQGSGVKSVYTLEEDGTVAIRTVTLGRHINGIYEILSGIEAGSKVVVKGHASLRNGIKVEVAQ